MPRAYRPLVSLPALLALSAALLLIGCGDSQSDRASASSGSPGSSAEANAEHTHDLRTFGRDLDHAVEIAPNVYQARGTGNAHVIATPAGRVVFDTGLPTESDAHREKLDALDASPITHLILSHAHQDHYGGFASFRDEGTEVIAHSEFPETQRYLYELVPALMRRNKFFYPTDVPNLPDRLLGAAVKALYPTVVATRLVSDRYEFELGGQRFVVLATPGAEGADALSLWLPEEKILFSGDTFGPIFPMFPNLTTIRGEKFRFAVPYIETLDRLIALELEMVVPSHFEPVTGKEKIRADLTRMRDAVRYVHDATVAGMNAGKSVYTLMSEIRLPEHLELSQAHGTVPWTVRGIYESYATWFHFDDTTQLYAVPARDVYADVAELAGSDALGARAAEHTAAGEPERALHLAAMALAGEPGNEVALRARLEALEELLERSGGVNHHELTWLETHISETKETLGD